ncbi:hypothetical protein Taro_015109 [Colocasia esculenta]|uniref:non-specific serine/threonine protein kinase n=1 Tax=Colocasia esculenta TaxID=4460 RepID=A0A843US75_COLES|nr:hypothetical protein [Colocasia esculenta]
MELKKGSILMRKYEVGRLLGQGNFAKVYQARSLETGQSVAIKVIDKEKVLRVGMIDQIKREISVMRLVRHPHVVRLYEVMASKAKIYFVMEHVKGGELFNLLLKGGKLQPRAARRYFQQLVGAVDFCHSRGVYHRDLKPENLLVDDDNGDLKVCDFGLSALSDTRHHDGLLHTTCGTPAYVAPEVMSQRGYDGAKADIWSCGVVLFVLLAGYLPFDDANLMEMYKKIGRAEFRCPHWFPSDARRLLCKLLDPNPSKRISIPAILENPWFKKDLKPAAADPHGPHVLSSSVHEDVHALFDDTAGDHDDHHGRRDRANLESHGSIGMRPTSLNAFDIISQSPGFDLSGLFEKDSGWTREASRFTSRQPASAIVSKLEEIAQTESFRVDKEGALVRMRGSKQGRKGRLAIEAEIFEVTRSFYMVELKKAAGDTIEYQSFCNQGLKPSLQDIVWTWARAN